MLTKVTMEYLMEEAKTIMTGYNYGLITKFETYNFLNQLRQEMGLPNLESFDLLGTASSKAES